MPDKMKSEQRAVAGRVVKIGLTGVDDVADQHPGTENYFFGARSRNTMLEGLPTGV